MEPLRGLDPSDNPKEETVGSILISCLGCLVVAVVVPCAAILAFHLIMAFSHWMEGVFRA